MRSMHIAQTISLRLLLIFGLETATEYKDSIIKYCQCKRCAHNKIPLLVWTLLKWHKQGFLGRVDTFWPPDWSLHLCRTPNLTNEKAAWIGIIPLQWHSCQSKIVAGEAENVSVELVSTQSGVLSSGTLAIAQSLICTLYSLGLIPCWDPFFHPFSGFRFVKWMEYQKCSHASNGLCSLGISTIFTFSWAASHPGILVTPHKDQKLFKGMALPEYSPQLAAVSYSSSTRVFHPTSQSQVANSFFSAIAPPGGNGFNVNFPLICNE